MLPFFFLLVVLVDSIVDVESADYERFLGVFIVVLQVHLVQLLWEFEGLGLGFTFMNFGLGIHEFWDVY